MNTESQLSRAARRRARQNDFLFDPERVEPIIESLPHLRSLLDDPHREGAAAVHLPGARKSSRELYRVLGNTHYDHLADLLRTLDACIGAGFTQPELLRTRGRRPFVEDLAELYTAEHFRRLGFSISGFDNTKGSESVSDILVEGQSITAVVEVYCPRVWSGLKAYVDTVHDRVKNLDAGYDFRFDIRHGQVNQFTPEMKLLYLYPDVLSKGLDDERVRLTAINALVGQLETGLRDGGPVSAKYEFPDLNLVTIVELFDITPASMPLPARGGVITGPATSGDRPELTFPDIVDRVIDKMKKGQAVDLVPGAIPVLVVQLSQAELTSELQHTAFYVPEFEKTLAARLTDLNGYGIVAFCEATGRCGRLITHFTRGTAAEATIRALFPSQNAQ